MILLTRLNGPEFALNPDLIERAEATPDTVLTLVDGKKIVVAESVAELIDLVRHFRASILSMAHTLEIEQGLIPGPQVDPDGHLTPLTNDEAALRVVAHPDRATVVPLHRDRSEA